MNASLREALRRFPGWRGYAGLLFLVALTSFLTAYYPDPLLGVGVGLFILVIWLFMVSPRLVVLLFLGLRASLDLFKGPATLYVSEAVRVSPAFFCSLLLIGLGLFYIIRNRVRLLEIPLVPALLFFQLLLLLHLLLTAEFLASLMEALRFLSILVLYILIYELFTTEGRLRGLILVVLLSSLFPVLTGLYQVMGEAGQYITGFVRANGTFVHPNPFAFYLVVILGVLINELLAGPDRVGRPRWLLPLGAAAVFCLLFTYTRTAWIGLFLLILSAAWFRDRRLLWIFAAFLALFVLAAPLRTRIEDLTTSVSSITHRFYIWRAGIEQLPAYPFLGRGPATFEILDIYGEQAHNDLLRIFVELGLVGVASYLFIVIELAGRLWGQVRRVVGPFPSALARAAFSVSCVFILASLTGNLFFRPAIQWYFWALVAASLNAARLPSAFSEEGI